jgi:hypothetical protein
MGPRVSGGHVRIIRNSARCNVCGDEVESTHVHDFQPCRCGNLAVDGGHEYLRRAIRDYAVPDSYTETSITEPDEETDVP